MSRAVQLGSVSVQVPIERWSARSRGRGGPRRRGGTRRGRGGPEGRIGSFGGELLEAGNARGNECGPRCGKRRKYRKAESCPSPDRRGRSFSRRRANRGNARSFQRHALLRVERRGSTGTRSGSSRQHGRPASGARAASAGTDSSRVGPRPATAASHGGSAVLTAGASGCAKRSPLRAASPVAVGAELPGVGPPTTTQSKT